MLILKQSNKRAYFRFEASPNIGAGHAVRSCVIADGLHEKGWECKVVTSKNTYSFISNLKRFERIDPDFFHNSLNPCDLLVVDNYDLGMDYETYFRPVAKKIMVIDDLANRKHNCDILLDQTFGRSSSEYKNLVPSNCNVLTGIEYALVRKEFRILKQCAIKKRLNTDKVNRILISMGGSDPDNWTLYALNEVKKSGFEGIVDIVLGFSCTHIDSIRDYIKILKNNCIIHIDADMPHLAFEADLAIGASGSSVWERMCVGLPQYLVVTADNQKKIYENLIRNKLCFPLSVLNQHINDKCYVPKNEIISGNVSEKLNNVLGFLE